MESGGIKRRVNGTLALGHEYRMYPLLLHSTQPPTESECHGWTVHVSKLDSRVDLVRTLHEHSLHNDPYNESEQGEDGKDDDGDRDTNESFGPRWQLG